MNFNYSIAGWLRENIPWLFSGAGVALITAALSRFRRSQGVGAQVSITSPSFGAPVSQVALITGKVVPVTSKVVVVVHLMASDGYWPQRKVSVRHDGSWAVEVFVGSIEPSDRGARFEIVAVADPLSSVDHVLEDWPVAKARSDVLQVIRN